MEHLHKFFTGIARRRGAGSAEAVAGHADQPGASQPQLHNASSGGNSDTSLAQRLPQYPGSPHLAPSRFLGHTSDDNVTIELRKLSRINMLSRALSAAGGGRGRSMKTAISPKSRMLDNLLALPPEMQMEILSYLDFGDLERLRRTCRFFHARLSPGLVRYLLAGDFHRSVRFTCRLCLKQYQSGMCLVSTDRRDAHYPLSSRCVDCVWRTKGFKVGRKYLMGSNVAVFVCRWCGSPVTSQPAWNQPEFHKHCFKRYTQVVFLYYLIGLLQWVVVIVGSGLCWHYFSSRSTWVTAMVACGFVLSLWVFCLNTVRGTIMRTYHFALILEAAILVCWLVTILALLGRVDRRKPPGIMTSFEIAMAVFILFNLIVRGINVMGNAILMCEYKLWRHKKPSMSPGRSAWVHAIEVFIFFVEPQCIEQEYPPKWWFRTRRPVAPPVVHDHLGPEVVGIAPGFQQPGVGPYYPGMHDINLPVP